MERRVADRASTPTPTPMPSSGRVYAPHTRITVARSYVGEYCTYLDMAGASVTLVKLDDELKELLSAPAEIAARVF
jgi:hypothetical protein